MITAVTLDAWGTEKYDNVAIASFRSRAKTRSQGDLSTCLLKALRELSSDGLDVRSSIALSLSPIVSQRTRLYVDHGRGWRKRMSTLFSGTNATCLLSLRGV